MQETGGSLKAVAILLTGIPVRYNQQGQEEISNMKSKVLEKDETFGGK